MKSVRSKFGPIHPMKSPEEVRLLAQSRSETSKETSSKKKRKSRPPEPRVAPLADAGDAVVAGPSALHVDARAPVADDNENRAAYERLLPRMNALSPDELQRITVDPTVAIALVKRQLREVSKFRGVLAEMPDFDVVQFDTLSDCVLALFYAQSRFVGAGNEGDPTLPLYDEGVTLRDLMLSDVRNLVKRGYLPSEVLDNLTSATGYRNVGQDLAGISTAVEEGWPKVQGRTTIDPSEIKRARDLGFELVNIALLRERGPVGVGSKGEMRQRAFTLLARAYNDARAAILYLRRNKGDADTIAPSLYGARASRAKTDHATPPPSPPPAPSPAPATATA